MCVEEDKKNLGVVVQMELVVIADLVRNLVRGWFSRLPVAESSQVDCEHMEGYKKFFETFLHKDLSEFVPCKRKTIGLEIDRFSDVLGRILIEGRVTYMSDKSFRSNKAFDRFKEENQLSKTVFLCLTCKGSEKSFYNPYTSKVVTKRTCFPAGELGTLENFFVNRQVPQCDWYVFGICEKVKKFLRNKQMYIKAENCMIYDREEDLMRITESTIFDSTYLCSRKEIEIAA